MSSQKSSCNFTAKELKSLKKEELVQMLLRYQESEVAATPGSPLISNGQVDLGNLTGLVKEAVLEAVRDVRAELRLDYQLQLNESEKKFNTEIQNLRSELQSLRKEFISQMSCMEGDFFVDIQDVVRRKENVMIFGLRESVSLAPHESKAEDLDTIQTLSSELGVENLEISSCHRLGRRSSSKPRPLKISCQNAQQRVELLRSAVRIPRLADSLGFKRVFIKPDLSPKEQAVERKLRQELRIRRLEGEQVIIRGGRIIPKTQQSS